MIRKRILADTAPRKSIDFRWHIDCTTPPIIEQEIAMNRWMTGVAAALMAAAIWFPTMSTTQEDALGMPAKPPKEISGLQVSARMEFPEKAPDPRLVLEATNPSGKEIKVTVKLELRETSIERFARMMPRPRTVWEKEIVLEVAPGKDQKVSIGGPQFLGFFSKKEADEVSRETLREIVVVCGDESATLIRSGRNFEVIK